MARHNDLTLEAANLYAAKNKSYASEDNAVENYHAVGDEIGIDPEKVAAIFLMKHIRSILAYVKDGKECETEPMRGRFIDAINYLVVLSVLTETREE